MDGVGRARVEHVLMYNSGETGVWDVCHFSVAGKGSNTSRPPLSILPLTRSECGSVLLFPDGVSFIVVLFVFFVSKNVKVTPREGA